MENSEIAALFDEVADILEIQGGDRFRIRAYRNAAMHIQELSPRLEDLIKNDDEQFNNLPGIGDRLREKIVELVNTGTFKQYEQLRKTIPEGLLELLKLGGLGPKKVKLLKDHLGVTDISSVEKACIANKLVDLPGMGEKTQSKILTAIAHYRQTQGRISIAAAEKKAQTFLAYLKAHTSINQLEIAGSLRRGKETVGDLDILASSNNPEKAANHFVSYEEVKRVLQHGETKCSVLLRSGLQVDFRLVDSDSFGAALLYFTGSKSHNVKLRSIAKRHQLKINEYGIYDVSDKRLASKTEQDIYKVLEMQWIAPQLREDTGEIESAANDTLPNLIEVGDIKGDLHAHTHATDGRHSIKQMVEAAKDRGYAYVAITDHTKSTRVAGGLNDKEFLKHIEAIRKVAKSISGIHVLCGAEVDILEDGSLDLTNNTLKELDIILISIHSHFNLPREKMTERILKAFDNPHPNLLCHPTGRLISNRKPYEVDLEAVFKKAKERNIFIEINSQPSRLDLKDTHCKAGKEAGVNFMINTDSHSMNGFDAICYGVTTARRGWIEADDVINTRTLIPFLKALKRA